MLQAAPLPAPTAVPGGTRAPPLPPGRAPRGADGKSGSGRRKPAPMRCFVCPLRSDGLPGESSGVPAATGRPASDAATLASQDGAPGAVRHARPSLAPRLLRASPSSPCPAWSPGQVSPRPALHRCLEWPWGKPLPEEAAPTGSGGAPPPVSPPSTIPVLRGVGGVGARAGLRVVGSLCPSPRAGPQHRFNLAFMCHRARERLYGAAVTRNTWTAAPRARTAGASGCGGGR